MWGKTIKIPTDEYIRLIGYAMDVTQERDALRVRNRELLKLLHDAKVSVVKVRDAIAADDTQELPPVDIGPP